MGGEALRGRRDGLGGLGLSPEPLPQTISQIPNPGLSTSLHRTLGVSDPLSLHYGILLSARTASVTTAPSVSGAQACWWALGGSAFGLHLRPESQPMTPIPHPQLLFLRQFLFLFCTLASA